VRRALPALAARGVKVITNAGGLNPRACREKIFEVARELGVSGLRVGVVEGDDLLARLPDLVARGHRLANMDSGEPITAVLDRVTSANAYLGARPWRRRSPGRPDRPLRPRHRHGARARPLVHEFGWNGADWDRLAAGTVAGHILECGRSRRAATSAASGSA